MRVFRWPSAFSNVRQENDRDFPEMIANTGAKLCQISDFQNTVLVIFQAAIFGRSAERFPTFLGQGPNSVADPFRTVPCRCL